MIERAPGVRSRAIASSVRPWRSRIAASRSTALNGSRPVLPQSGSSQAGIRRRGPGFQQRSGLLVRQQPNFVETKNRSVELQ
ncbi:hypothetical protein [Kitasatospora griseola]|uniref:hypothetical protein n=1 Tax=Kitasatospora griseola TaxID=2064 RepID=UPI00380717BF